MPAKTETELVMVGTVQKEGERRSIVLAPEYRPGLAGLEGFSHAMVVWWADRFEEHRFLVDMVIDLPYASGVTAGLFTTRSPVRPNPICINTCRILGVDTDAGRIDVDEIDAYQGYPRPGHQAILRMHRSGAGVRAAGLGPRGLSGVVRSYSRD
jgi:tRNA (adenine37-N6)-methyltransferase